MMGHNIEELVGRIRRLPGMARAEQERVISDTIVVLNELSGRNEGVKEVQRNSYNEKSRQREEELKFIHDLIISLNQGDSLKSLIDKLFGGIRRIFNNHAAIIYLLSEDKQYLEMFRLSLPGEIIRKIEKVIGMNIPRTRIELHSGSLYSEILLTGKPHLCNNSLNIQRMMRENTSNKMLQKLVPAVFKILKIVSVINIPLISEGKIIGLIDIDRKTPFDEEDLSRISLLSDLVTAIIKQRQNEDRIKTALQEKDLMLREIHHRIKNNLQMISSLLSLQARRLKDTEASEKLTQCNTRIQAMALIHNKLYGCKDVTQIDLRQYLQELIYYLRSIYGKSSNVQFSIELDDIHLNLDRTIPLGLIINEIITNALKHAFSPEQRGLIIISLKKNCQNILLTVRDNGRGIPEEIDIDNSKTVGLLIINSLVDQLEGTIDIQRDNGTCITIDCPYM